MLHRTYIAIALGTIVTSLATPNAHAGGGGNIPANWGKPITINSYARDLGDAQNRGQYTPQLKNDTGFCMAENDAIPADTRTKIVAWRKHDFINDVDKIYISGAGPNIPPSQAELVISDQSARVAGAEPSSHSFSNPEIATDGQNGWIVVWGVNMLPGPPYYLSMDEIWFARSFDGGYSWTRAQVWFSRYEKQLITGDYMRPRVAMSTRMFRITFATYDNSTGNYALRATSGGGDGVLMNSGTLLPQPGGIATDHYGHWYMVWKRGAEDIYFSYGTDGGLCTAPQPLLAIHDSTVIDGVSDAPMISMNNQKWAVTWGYQSMGGDSKVLYAEGVSGSAARLTYEVAVPPNTIPANWYIKPDVCVNGPRPMIAYTVGQQLPGGVGTEDYTYITYRAPAWTVPTKLGRTSTCGNSFSDAGRYPRFSISRGSRYAYVIMESWNCCPAEGLDISDDGDGIGFWWDTWTW